MAAVESVEEPAQRLPIHYEYCVQVYEAMNGDASVEHLGTGFGDEQGLVYDGFMTKLFEDLGLSVPYYTKILRELQRMDCVRQLRRGGSTTTSRWLLVQEPSVELFFTANANIKAQRGSRMDKAEQQLRDMNNRLNRVEEALGL